MKESQNCTFTYIVIMSVYMTISSAANKSLPSNAKFPNKCKCCMALNQLVRLHRKKENQRTYKKKQTNYSSRPNS